jgi:phage FluMu protein Com
MNIRCAFCQTPYTLSRVAMLDALQEVDSKKLTHYDAHCPRCRRATQIPRQRLEMAMPNWRDELKQFEAEMKQHPQHAAPVPAHESVPAAEAESKPEPKAAMEENPAPAPKRAPGKEPAAAASKRKKTTKKSK